MRRAAHLRYSGPVPRPASLALVLVLGAFGARAAPPGEAVSGRMIAIPGARLPMGSPPGDADADADERPRHPVAVAPFHLDATEVTVAAYAACVRTGTCSAADQGVSWDGLTEEARRAYGAACNFGRPDRAGHPINCVTWAQARAFCAWAGKRLPSEAEWELAARGAGRRYPWGEEPPTPRRVNGCHAECAAAYGLPPGELLAAGPGDGFATTAPVGSFPAGASPDGVLDLGGNVWEWTESRYCPYPAEGDASCDDPRRVLRGGAFNVTRPPLLRGAYRFRALPQHRFELVGFRCAR